MLLNVYDLSPANESLHWLGFGAYHSGVEVYGAEYTFANSGVFSSTPKDAGGAPLRETIVLGEVFCDRRDVERASDELRREFPPGSYNLLQRNCNTFADALVQKLLGIPIPGWVNRSATVGRYCSCLLPEDQLGSAPVESGGASGSGSGFHVVPGRGRKRETRGTGGGHEVLSFAGGGSSSFSSGDAGPADSAARSRARPSFQGSGGRRIGAAGGNAAASATSAPASDTASGMFGSLFASSPEPVPVSSTDSGSAASRREMMLKAVMARTAAAEALES